MLDFTWAWVLGVAALAGVPALGAGPGLALAWPGAWPGLGGLGLGGLVLGPGISWALAALAWGALDWAWDAGGLGLVG